MHPHYSDGQLLSFLDGELPLHRLLRLQFHLFRCWDCRSRRAELEQQAHRLAQALRQDSFPGPQRIADARERFEQWIALDTHAVPVRNTATSTRMRLALMAASCAVVALSFTFLTAPRPARQTAKLLAPRPASIQSPPAATPPTQPRPVARVLAKVSVPPQPRRETAARADLDAVEADVHYRLHRIGACAGEPILITRKSTATLLVTAVAPPAARRQDIEEAISDLRDTHVVAFEAAGEAPAPIRLEAVGDGSRTSVTNRLSESPLMRTFRSTPDFLDRAATVIRLTEGLYTEALGLTRHREIPSSVRSQKSAARWLIESMEREHVSSMRHGLAGIEQALAPLSTPEPAVCTARDEQPLPAAESLAAVVHRLFAPTTTEDLALAEQTFTDLPAALQRVRCSLP